jgi:hypothetical protein
MSVDKLADAYNAVIDQFEPMPEIPNLNASDASSLDMSATVSIAISLKRIADKLELASKQPIMMTAEEALKYYKDRDGC